MSSESQLFKDEGDAQHSVTNAFGTGGLVSYT